MGRGRGRRKENGGRVMGTAGSGGGGGGGGSGSESVGIHGRAAGTLSCQVSLVFPLAIGPSDFANHVRACLTHYITLWRTGCQSPSLVRQKNVLGAGGEKSGLLGVRCVRSSLSGGGRRGDDAGLFLAGRPAPLARFCCCCCCCSASYLLLYSKTRAREERCHSPSTSSRGVGLNTRHIRPYHFPPPLHLLPLSPRCFPLFGLVLSRLDRLSRFVLHQAARLERTDTAHPIYIPPLQQQQPP